MVNGPQRKRHFFSALHPIIERAKKILNLPIENRGTKRSHAALSEVDEVPASRPKKEFILPDLPDEIWLQIIKQLPLSSLAKVARLSKFFLNLSRDDSLWREKAKEIGMPERFLATEEDIEINPKWQLQQFILECKRLREVYPQQLLNAFDKVEQLAALPSLEVGKENHGRYLDFINASQMLGHKMKRGETDRPFLTLCVRCAGENKILVQTLFQRYLHSKKVWVAAGDRILPGGEVDPKAWAYLKRLIAGEPCGVLGFPKEGSPTTKEGEDAVALYDQLPKCR